MKRVLLLAAGGTIASLKSETGLVPGMRSEELLHYIPELTRRFEVDCQDGLHLDSSNIQPEDWKMLASQVSDHIADYDGVVISHGTDTMAYTASALSFMLRNLEKSVILTGSQVPINKLCSDAARNLQLAFAAVDAGITGVSLAFDNLVIRGCRASKIRTMGFHAFDSIGFPPLAESKGDGLHLSGQGRPTAGEFHLQDDLCTDVIVLKIFPGLRPETIDMICQAGYRGIVLESFGAGGAPFTGRDLVDRVHWAVDQGVAVVACSQCLYEPSDFTIYEVGTRLLDGGVIPARDMTTEAIVTKLMWGLGQSRDLDHLREIFNTNYCDEISL